MKKSFIYGAIVALALPLTFAHAASSALVATKIGTTVAAKPVISPKTKAATPPTPVVVEPLSVRKEQTLANLSALQAQFVIFAARTQDTINLLAAKGIDTTEAQADLDASTAALDLAKTNLTLFGLIAVNDNIPEKTTSEFTVTLAKIETNLTDARTQLIASLTSLKASIALTIGTTQPTP